MKAEYIDHLGSDLTVVNAARVSFDKQRHEVGDKDVALIRYLSTHGHWTPFAHPQITVRETVPIFVARQRFKHTIGFAYNEVSRRYVDDTPEFYHPETWRARPDGSVKQGSAGPIDDQELAGWEFTMAVEVTRQAYDRLLTLGVAPEQARMVLPQAMYTSYFVTGSLAAWARAYKLRADSHAQAEIQALADHWSQIIEPLFPVSWKALTT